MFFPPFVTAELLFFKEAIVDQTTCYQDDNFAEMLFQEIETSSLLTQDAHLK